MSNSNNSVLVNVFNAVHMIGVSNKGRGGKYDFAQINYILPYEELNTEFCVRTCTGLELVSVGTSKEIVEQIKAKNFDFPLDMRLELAADPRDLQRNICVGFSIPDAKPDPLKKFSSNAPTV